MAVDIPLDAASTTVSYPPNAAPTLFHSATFGYYVGDGAGAYFRVGVSAMHETATDSSMVQVHSPQALFSTSLQATSVNASALTSAGERLLQVDGKVYVEQRQSVGGQTHYSYREAGIQQTLQHTAPTSMATLQPDASLVAGNYSGVDVTTDFHFNSQIYKLSDAANVTFRSSAGTELTAGALVKDDNGNLYLQNGTPGNETYSRLNTVTQLDRLNVAVSASPANPTGNPPTAVSGDFTFGGNTFNLGNFDEIVGQPAGSTLVVADDNTFYWRTGDGTLGNDYEYYELTALNREYDLTLTGSSNVFLGADFSSVVSLSGQVLPPTDFSTFDKNNISFQGADFSHLGDLTVVRSTGANQPWLIRGQRIDGGYEFFEAQIELEFDTERQLSSVTASATQATGTALGIPSHEQDTVSGVSAITIDPRNVSVEYTDLHGKVHSNVLQQDQEGNYYFMMPGENEISGNYKIATLVDIDGFSEVSLKTVNGAKEIVVFYPSNVSRGGNLSIVALTDANGADDGGVPHTRLQIREVDEGIRMRVPRNPLAAIDRAIAMVDAKRSHLGAMENRLESIIQTNTLTSINLKQARSRIMDADYAVEVAKLSRQQILQQTGSSMLAQANQTVKNVLSLLG